MKITANKDTTNTINNTHNKVIPNRVNIVRHINQNIIDFIIIYNL
jgi:hypothetical protein